MKFMAFQLVAACVMALAGCTSAPTTHAEAATAVRDDRCQVTGSNLPRRDCRGDVTILPPSAVESVMPVLPGPGGRP